LKGSKVLRDLREATKLLILLEITANRHTKMKTIAEVLDMTVQGISDYIKIMSREGYVQNVGGVYRATKKGVEFLHDRFIDLKDFVDRSIQTMSIVNLCGAIAATDIEEGQRVGLFMENGRLVAYANRDSSSMGTALFPAKAGEDVVLKDLEGLVSLSPGKITLLKLPSPKEGGTRSIDMKKGREIVKSVPADRIGATDEVGVGFAHKLGLHLDFEFAPVQASIEAAERGLNVLLLCSQDVVGETIGSIEATNSLLEDKIDYEVITI